MKRATRKPARATRRQRRASRISCSMMSRRRLRFCDLSRNSIAAQRMRLKRMRLIRWMMIGALTRAAPAIMYAGLRNSQTWRGVPLVAGSLIACGPMGPVGSIAERDAESPALLAAVTAHLRRRPDRHAVVQELATAPRRGSRRCGPGGSRCPAGRSRGAPRPGTLPAPPGSRRAGRAGRTVSCGSSSIPSKRVVPVKGKFSSSSSRTWKTRMSCRPCRSISRPRKSGSRSTSRSETRTIMPRLATLSATRRRIFSMSVLSRGRLTSIALHDGVDVRLLAARRDDLAHVLVEGDAADRVLLAQQQVGQAGGDGAAVVVLVQRPAAVVHRLADVDDQGAAQVGLFLELLDVEAVGLGPDLPVEVADVVAGGVLAVLHELDRVAEERAAVHAGDEALDDVLGAQVEPRDAGDRLGMQEAARIVFFGGHGADLNGESNLEDRRPVGALSDAERHHRSRASDCGDRITTRKSSGIARPWSARLPGWASPRAAS